MSGGQRGNEEGQRYSRRTRGAADPDACAGLGLDGLGCSAGQPYYTHVCMRVYVGCEQTSVQGTDGDDERRYACTYAGVEGEVVEGAVVEKTGFVLRDTVADLERRVDGGCRALERREVVELRERHRVANPGEELLGRDDPG